MTYTEQMALHVSPYGVRVNCIHPPTSTPTCCTTTGSIRCSGLISKRSLGQTSAGIQALPGLAGSWLEPEDVADLVCFLASDESKNITGDNIRIDAGSFIKWPNGPQ